MRLLGEREREKTFAPSHFPPFPTSRFCAQELKEPKGGRGVALVGKYLIRFELVRVASAAREIVHVGERLVERCPPTGLEVSPCPLPQEKGRKKSSHIPFSATHARISDLLSSFRK